MRLPLHNKLKKQQHRNIAEVQDLIMRDVYSYFPHAVLHGGTAIWRCYGGNRFSEDLDFYLPSKERVEEFFQNLERQNFRVLKQRVKENSLYSLLELNRVQVRFEAIFKKKEGEILKEYEMADGNLITVYTLSADKLLQEKIDACLKRKKVRDLYDVFFLLRFAHSRPKGLAEIEKVQIEDEKAIHAIILTGPIPSVEEMKRYIASWAL